MAKIKKQNVSEKEAWLILSKLWKSSSEVINPAFVNVTINDVICLCVCDCIFSMLKMEIIERDTYEKMKSKIKIWLKTENYDNYFLAPFNTAGAKRRYIKCLEEYEKLS